MSKFRVWDSVRVIDPTCTRNDTTGTINHHNPDLYYAYEVTFPDGHVSYYRSIDLLLAPGEHE